MLAQLGIGFDKPIRHLREYLNVLMPLLREGSVEFNGETPARQLFQKPRQQIPVLVAALGPQALAVTGQWADGTTLAWVGPKTIREHIVRGSMKRLRHTNVQHREWWQPCPYASLTHKMCVIPSARA